VRDRYYVCSVCKKKNALLKEVITHHNYCQACYNLHVTRLKHCGLMFTTLDVDAEYKLFARIAVIALFREHTKEYIRLMELGD
jgi:hypothetical protein